MGDSFTHLHVHTEYSMLDGAARLDELVAAAAADGQPALGITDHGNMYGVLDFYSACRNNGVKPIIGLEAYMAYDQRTERPRMRGGQVDDGGGEAEGGRKAYYHLTLLAENEAGYKNLIQLASRAYLEGYYQKPKIDWQLLDEHHDGVIATSGCLGGHVLQALVPTHIMEKDRIAQGRALADSFTEEERFDKALKLAGRFQDIFGRDNFFIELQDHGIDAQTWSNPRLVEIADALGAPMLATNDSHYVTRADAKSHDALLCVQTGSQMSDTNRFKFHGDDHFLKTAAEMRRLFSEVPSACDNSLWIAERANVEIEFGQPQLPEFPLPAEFDSDDEYLRHLTMEGARRRWGDPIPDPVVERLAYELQVISHMGFSAYFVITWDLIRHAREQNIRVGPGRGSAAGCAVAYCLQITDLDPIRYDLLFERFLNPSRVSMPDIDMDFDSRFRDEMIRYAAERYGRDHVAQIVTFSQIKARAAVRDAARVLGYPYSVGDKVAKAMPPLVMGRDTPLWACMSDEPPERFVDGWKVAAELRQMSEDDPDVGAVVEVALGLEGMRRQDGIHAAAVVITRDPLTEYLPIQRKPEAGQEPSDAPVVTQYEMNGVESLGLLKMDFLGLRNLDVISDTLELVRDGRGIDIDVDALPLDDDRTLEMLRRGDSIGVFQLEGGPMRTLMRSLAPTSFDDVAALVALYRPGPMAANMHNDYADRKNGRKKVKYFHPDAKELLGDTYGLMIYQESVMRVAQKFAGYSLADADLLRKAMGKKKREIVEAERDKFVNGCDSAGYGVELGTELFDVIEQFADYAFNKSHSYGYGYVSYQTAYLKAHYPVEYLAALLTSVKHNLEKAAVYLAECRRIGVKVLVPDVNVSGLNFIALPGSDAPGEGPGSIPFGLSAVRNVGEGHVGKIIAEREANGPYHDFFDFIERVDLTVLNKRTIESLIKAGAFDSFSSPRMGLLSIHERMIDAVVARRRERDAGVMSLFDDTPTSGDDDDAFDERLAVPDAEFDKTTKLNFEKEMLGLYVSDHPLFGVEASLARLVDCSITDLVESAAAAERGETDQNGRRGGGMRTVGGVVTSLQRKYTRKGDLMAVFTLEDLETSVEVMVFPRTMADYGALLDDDAVVLISGRVDTRDDDPKIICQEVRRPELQLEGVAPPLRIRLAANRLVGSLPDRLRDLLRHYPGQSEVFLHLGEKVLRLPDEFRVDVAGGLLGELRALLGADAVVT